MRIRRGKPLINAQKWSLNLGLFLVLLTLSFQGKAQIFPVQSSTQLVPPYSVYLSDYATPGNEKLRVILVQRDLTQPSYQLRLVMQVEWNGKVIMRTSRSYNPAPISLDPGVPTIISGAELFPYLDSRNIDFVGYSREQYERTKALPEGSCRISFTAYDYRRQDVQVSNEGSSFYYLSKNEPPLINMPVCGAKVPVREPQQVVFSWLPRNTSSPTSAMETRYEFSLYEIRPEGRNPNDVVLSSQPVFKTTIDHTQLVYGPAEPQLIENMRYAWRVRAVDTQGRGAFRNNGYSEVCTFTYGGVDLAYNLGVPENFQAEGETERRARVWWEKGHFDSYRIYYKKTGAGHEWFHSDVGDKDLGQGTDEGEMKLFDLEPDTEYEARAQGRRFGEPGPYTEVVKFRTLPVRAAHCGEPAQLSGDGTEGPYLSAVMGDIVAVDGMEMTLTEVEHLGGGWYSGAGRVAVDYLGGAPFPVTFGRIFINADREAGVGRIDFVTKGVGAMAEEQLAEQGKRKGEREAESLTVNGNGNEGKDIIFEGVIDSILVDEKGEIIIIDTEGERFVYGQIIDPVTGEVSPVNIVDQGGNGYVVDKDGKVTKGSRNGGNTPAGMIETDSVLFVQKELIKEVLEHYIEEINLWLENNGKGPLEEALVRRLYDLPSCLPEDEEGLEAVLVKVEEYLEDPEALLALVKEDDTNKARIEELTAILIGNQPPYAAGLSETEWEELLEMVCPYLVVEEERPKLVTIEPITDDQFAAGIDNDKLKITYSIRVTEKYPLQYAKLEVYKNNGTLAYVNSETIEIGEEKTFEWNGKMNRGNDIDKYIRYDDGEFTIKVTASIDEDFSNSFAREAQAIVFRKTDEFRDNPDVVAYITPPAGVSKFEYYLLLEEELYNIISKNKTNREIIRNFSNGLDYLGEKVNKRTFIGREVMVHDSYWTYLQDIDSKLGSEFDNHPDYTIGGFSIRFQLGSNDAVSNHAYGMALDVKPEGNPYLNKGQLYFLQLLTDFKFYQNPSNPKDLKEAHNKLIGFGYQQDDITSVKDGFKHLNQSSLKNENFETLLNETLRSYRSAAATFSQLVSRNTHLRNETHFFNQKTPQELADIERQLFEELPAEADALLETIKSIKSTEEISQLYDLYKEGYSKAFLLDKHKVDENTALLVALGNLKEWFGFETAITSLKEACEQPANGDYTYWLTNVTITYPKSIPEASSYQAIGTFIESRRADYKEIFNSTNDYSGIIGVLNNSATPLAKNGFMLMSAEFAQPFVDVGNSIISWGGNWKGLKDFMHMEYVEKDRFNDK